MNPTVALIYCVVLVTVLLFIERKRNIEASKALWVPTFWMLISGSRPVINWFETGQISPVGSAEAGSPLDRLVLSILILLAVIILFRRKIDWSQIIKNNYCLIILYLFLALSILWSDFPYVSFKRWIRLCGTIPIALVVLSERSPFNALESVLRRCAYVMIPFSLLLVKYFPILGRQYSETDGALMWVGVASQKNGLGVICALSAFFIFWSFLRDRQGGTHLKSKITAIGDILVLAIAIHLLIGPSASYSATAVAILIAGAASLLVLKKTKYLIKQAATFFVFGIAFILLWLPFDNSLSQAISSIFKRDDSFTGRTLIWREVIDVGSRNPLLGVGYGGYWGLKDEITRAAGVKESHNGFLDVYLDVGIVGIVLLLGFLLALYRKLLRGLKDAYDWAIFGISFLIMLLLHNFSEGDFLRTNYFWSFSVYLSFVFTETILANNRVN